MNPMLAASATAGQGFDLDEVLGVIPRIGGDVAQVIGLLGNLLSDPIAEHCSRGF